MRPYTRLKKLLRHLDSSEATLRPYREISRIRIAKAVLPVLVVGILLGAIAAMDHWLFKNPEQHELLLARELAYHRNISEAMRANPWGTLEKDPKTYIRGMFLSMEPELRTRLDAILEKMPAQHTLFFAKVFRILELRPEQLSRLTAKIERMIASGSAEKKIAAIPRIIITARKILTSLASSGGLASGAGSGVSGAAGGSAAAAPQPAAGEAGKASAEAELLARAVDVFLAGDEDAEAGAALLAGLKAGLSPENAAELSLLSAALSSDAGEKLLALADNLSGREFKQILDTLARLPGAAGAIMIGRLSEAGANDAAGVSALISQIPAATAVKFLNMTKDFSGQNFFALTAMASGFNQATLNQFIALGEKTPASVLEDAVGVVSAMGGQWQSKAVGILGDVKADSAAKLVDVAKQIGTGTTVEKGVKVLDGLGSVDAQEKAIGVMHNLNSKDLVERSITILDGISASAAKLTVNLASDLGAEDQKKAFNVLGRLQGKDGKDNFGRIEDVARRFTEVGDSGVLSKALSAVATLDDKALNQAVSVMVNLDGQRTAKAVNTITRVSAEERASAVDTMDRIPVAHLKNAVDIANESDDKMLKDAVAMTDRFKVRLKDDEALASTERAINIASKVDPGTRRIGLSALMQESDITAKRALSQVDGREEIFTPARVSQMADVYSKVDRASQTKLAEIVAGSSGLVVMGVGENGGAAQTISQQRKLDLIKGAMDNKDKAPEKFGRQLELLKKRPVLVPQGAEEVFQVKAPVAVVGVRGKSGGEPGPAPEK